MLRPSLDVTEVIQDPEFRESFTLYRRTRDVRYGRSDDIVETMLTLEGVIQPAPSYVLERLNNGDWRNGGITVWSLSRFEINTNTNLPDEIWYEGNRYMVVEVKDWTHYGRGYMEITALLLMDKKPNGYDDVKENINPCCCDTPVEPSPEESFTDKIEEGEAILTYPEFFKRVLP